MEKGFLLYWVTLDGANIFPGHIKCSTLVVSYFTYPGVAVWDGAAMPTGITAYPVAVEFFVEISLSNLFRNDIVQGSHCCSPCQASACPCGRALRHRPRVKKLWVRLSFPRGGGTRGEGAESSLSCPLLHSIQNRVFSRRFWAHPIGYYNSSSTGSHHAG